MCGIGVFISKNKINKTCLMKKMHDMTISQYHRGPDNAEVFCDESVGMCHTRLSIIDLSPKGNQPMLTEDSNFVITYNGELYNYVELRKQLVALGHKFISDSDTEVVLKSYVQWGTDAFVKFNGMFAFAIYDKKRKKVVAARDRIGIKFLHYYIDNKKIILASEVKAILKILNNTRYSRKAIDDVILLGNIAKLSTCFEDIFTLQPGKYLEIDLQTNETKLEYYFNLLAQIDPQKYITQKGLPTEKLVDELDGLLQESVKMHLISDAPLGTLCSGGLDSSLITAIATKMQPDVRIYHCGIEEGGGEEEYAQMVAEHLDIDIHYTYTNRQSYLEDFPGAIYHMEIPIFHPSDISFYQISKLAYSQGVKVLLSGEGADEFFGGYWWIRDLIRNTAFASENSPVNLSMGWNNDYIFSAGLHYLSADRFKMMNRYSLLYNGGKQLTRWNTILDSFSFLNNISEQVGKSAIVDDMLGYLPTCLYRSDRMGMKTSIETRVPIIENRIIDFAINLPLEYAVDIRSGKKLLKKVSERYLPQKLVYRNKRGFPSKGGCYVAFNEDLFRDGFVEQHVSVPTKVLQRLVQGDQDLLFRLISVETWGRLFVFNQKIDEVNKLFSDNCQKIHKFAST